MFSADLGVTPSSANYIEDVFSTYLYTGNSTSGGTQTITNNVDLSTKGGMVWIKGRSAASNNVLFDTARGAGANASDNQAISSNLSYPQDLLGSYDFLSAFNTTGFTVKQGGATTATRSANYNGTTYSSWTFRKQAKFFDIVTYTGNGSNRTISHNLGSTPGCIFIKGSDDTKDWVVYHRGLTNASSALILNSTSSEQSSISYWNNTAPTSTVFSVGTNLDTNENNKTYVAYLFAHNAGGFGATGTDNVISCGSFTGDGSGAFTVNLGYEPQWILWKSISASQWYIFDTMRGFLSYPVSTSFPSSSPNLADADNARSDFGVTSTGFKTDGGVAPGGTYIYIAIRRGPMKTPTTGTSVFSAKTYVGTTTSAEVTHDVTFDAEISANRGTAIAKYLFVDSLRGMGGVALQSAFTSSEIGYPTYWSRKSQRTMYAPSQFDDWWAATSTNQNHISYGLVRAPGFFDVVCYTGTGVANTVSHNLGVAPELMIVKGRSVSNFWRVYSATLGNTQGLSLNGADGAYSAGTAWNSTTPTSVSFSVNANSTNQSSATFVAYLFATVAGVSKVGSYTGSGTTKQIDCGFTGGARFVLIKRTDTIGDWYVWDSARGIVAGNDPYLLLNSTAAEVTSTDYIDTYSAGFELSSTAPAALNANGGSYIFLAIA